MNSYLNVGLYICHFKAYFDSFVDHLAFNKLKHWELDLRRLAAASLALMTPINP